MGNEIQKIRDAVTSQLKKTDDVIASNEAIADLISEFNNTLSGGFDRLSDGLQELCFISEEGFREVVYRLDLQNQTLMAIKEILERPLDTQAKELRKRAEVAYLNKWFDEAEMDLIEAEKKNYQDFIVHHMLGNIYYHHRKNYPKALEYYQKAAKYAVPFSQKGASDSLLCAAMVYYEFGQVADAFKSTGMALEMMSEDPHVMYHHARYTAKIGYEFTGLLKECIYKDPNYIITADRDDMFSDVKGKINKLAEDLRNEKKSVVDNLLKAVNSAKKEAETVGIYPSLDTQLADINELYTRNSYLDLLKAEQLCRKTYEENVSEWIKMKNAFRDELESKANKVKNKTYADWGFLIAVIAGILAYAIISNLPQSKPRKIGPVEIITFTSGTRVSLRNTSYNPTTDTYTIIGGRSDYTIKAGYSAKVLAKPKEKKFWTEDWICIRIKREEGCLPWKELSNVAKLGNGYVDDYSGTLSMGSQVFCVLVFSTIIWTLSATIIRRINYSAVTSEIEKESNTIARLLNLKKI